jgi:hypothetical protein
VLRQAASNVLSAGGVVSVGLYAQCREVEGRVEYDALEGLDTANGDVSQPRLEVLLGISSTARFSVAPWLLWTVMAYAIVMGNCVREQLWLPRWKSRLLQKMG